MRVIGGKDYYDSAVAYGIDPGIVFVRNNQILTNGQMERIGRYNGPSVALTHKDDHGSKITYKIKRRVANSPYDHSKNIDGTWYSLRGHSVIFCGKVYTGLEVHEQPNGKASSVHFFWSLDRLQKWAASRNLIAGGVTSYWNRKNNNEDPFNVVKIGEAQTQAMIDYNLAIVAKVNDEVNLHHSKPGWAEAESGWLGNCEGLGAIGFQSAIDPYTAFQELSMWVGGTLATNGPHTVTITDNNIKIAKHGFDKFSFRKPKQ